MWVLVMFDLPVDTKKAKKDYRIFREFLIEYGFFMMQYSVYARHAPSSESADVHEERVRKALPPDGEVRMIRFTDKQFQRMKVYMGKMRGPTEKTPEQISFF
jgi:CRISPR-associated protein Cas2